MARKNEIKPGGKLGLRLTTPERTLLLEEVTCLPGEYTQEVRNTPADQPVMLTLDELDDLGGYVAAEANHAKDRRLRKKLDAIFQRIQRLLETHTDEPPPMTLKLEDAKKAKLLAEYPVQLAEWTAQALATAEQLGIKKKPVENFWLAPAQRDVLMLVPGLSKTIRNKLAKEAPSLTVEEVASITSALAGVLPECEAPKQLAVLLVAKHLIDRLQEGIVGPAKPKAGKGKGTKIKEGAKTLFQFKITLKETTPPIWRRIQVADCTLDNLHEHIQTAMGWTNSHLHQFKIDGKTCGDPELLEDGFDDLDCIDSTEDQRGRSHRREAVPVHLRVRLRRQLAARDLIRGQPPI